MFKSLEQYLNRIVKKGIFFLITDRLKRQIYYANIIAQSLSNHASINEYLLKYNHSNVDRCPCVLNEIQTIEHVSYFCLLLNNYRIQLLRSIISNGHSWRPNMNTQLTNDYSPLFVILLEISLFCNLFNF